MIGGGSPTSGVNSCAVESVQPVEGDANLVSQYAQKVTHHLRGVLALVDDEDPPR